MPELHRRPRRRIGGPEAPADFACEQDVRAAVAALRKAHSTLAAAEASPEWHALRRRVARWVLRTLSAHAGAEEIAFNIARVYLRKPHFLPALPPSGAKS